MKIVVKTMTVKTPMMAYKVPVDIDFVMREITRCLGSQGWMSIAVEAMNELSNQSSRYTMEVAQRRYERMATEARTTGTLARAISRRAAAKTGRPSRVDYVGFYGLPGKSYSPTETAGDPRVYGWSAEFGFPGGKKWLGEDAERRIRYWAERKGLPTEIPPEPKKRRKKATLISQEEKALRKIIGALAQRGTNPATANFMGLFSQIPYDPIIPSGIRGKWDGILKDIREWFDKGMKGPIIWRSRWW